MAWVRRAPTTPFMTFPWQSLGEMEVIYTFPKRRKPWQSTDGFFDIDHLLHRCSNIRANVFFCFSITLGLRSILLLQATRRDMAQNKLTPQRCAMRVSKRLCPTKRGFF